MKEKKVNIAIVVHGKFHAFDLALALKQNGHKVTVFTNYPKWKIDPRDNVFGDIQSFWMHGMLSRLSDRLRQYFRIRMGEVFLHKLFSIWASHKLRYQNWDFIICWSGVSEEIINNRNQMKFRGFPFIMLVRGSSHIVEQLNILKTEAVRSKAFVELPNRRILEREVREYAKADCIRVISTFAYKTFIRQGVDKSKLALIMSADPDQKFSSSDQEMKRRIDGVKLKPKLCFGYAGQLSPRKGLFDLKQIVKGLGDEFEYIFVGKASSRVQKYFEKQASQIQWAGQVENNRMKTYFQKMDVFVFPSLEEGYAQVMAQAMTNGIPVLTTTNTQGPDVIVDGHNGWVFPVCEPDMFIKKLRWLNLKREVLSQMMSEIKERRFNRSWSQVAEEVVAEYFKRMKAVD